MRPAASAGSRPAWRSDCQVTPPSALTQTSPGFDAVPKPGAGGAAPAPLAYTPLTAQRLTPADDPVCTMDQALSATCPPALGRSTRAKLAPPSAERNSPTSVPARTTAGSSGSTATA